MSKRYKLKAEYFVETDETRKAASVDVLFVCDPERNTECKKTNCGECQMTSNIEFAKRFDFDE